MKKTIWTVVTLFVAFIAFPVIAQAGDEAAVLYKAKCAMCHAPDGSGDTPMGKKNNLRALASPEVQSQTDAQLMEMISNGGPNKKPGHNYKAKGLTDQQIKGLISFIRTLKK